MDRKPGREGLSEEVVAAAVQELEKTGTRISTRNVHLYLRSIGQAGSPNTVDRHLKSLGYLKREPLPDTLPANAFGLIKQLELALQAAVAAACEHSERRCTEADNDNSALRDDIERLEHDKERLQNQVASLMQAIALHDKTIQEQTAQLEARDQDIARERAATQEAHIQAAQNRLLLEQQARQIADQQELIKHLQEQLQIQQTELIETQRQQATVIAQRDGLELRLQESQQRERSAAQEVAQLRERLESCQTTASEAAAQLAGLQSAITAGQKLQTHLATENDRLHTELAQAHAQIRELALHSARPPA